jgi:ribosomal protein L31E
MYNIHQHIIQLKEVLQFIEEYLDKYTDEDLLAEKVSQLNNIEKTIRNLQKNNTAIPAELRELKLNLVNETDKWQEAKKRKPEIIGLLQNFITKHTDYKINKVANKLEKRIILKPRVKKFSEQVEISDLLEAGILKNGIELYRTYKGHNFTAFIKDGGSIETQVNGKLEQFSTPSAAAVAVSNKSQNGWIWWFTSFEGTKRELDYYRKKYLDDNNG